MMFYNIETHIKPNIIFTFYFYLVISIIVLIIQPELAPAGGAAELPFLHGGHLLELRRQQVGPLLALLRHLTRPLLLSLQLSLLNRPFSSRIQILNETKI